MDITSVFVRATLAAAAIMVPFSSMTVYSATAEPQTVVKSIGESFYLTTSLEETPDVAISQIKVTYRYDSSWIEYIQTIDRNVDGGIVVTEVTPVAQYVDVTFTYLAPSEAGTTSLSALFYAEFKCKKVTGAKGIKFPIKTVEVTDVTGSIVESTYSSPDTLVIVPRIIKIIGRLFSSIPQQ